MPSLTSTLPDPSPSSYDTNSSALAPAARSRDDPTRLPPLATCSCAAGKAARFGRAHYDGRNFACAVGKKGRMSRRKVRPTRILSTMGSREITGRKAPRGRQAPVSLYGRLSGRGLRAGTGHLVVCAIAEAVPIQTHVLSLHARCRWRRGAIWKRKTRSSRPSSRSSCEEAKELNIRKGILSTTQRQRTTARRRRRRSTRTRMTS